MQLEIEMNIEQALNAADESEAEGLRGLYPTAAQVLGAEVRELREKLAQQVKVATDQIDYAIALQRAIEAHCRDQVVGPFEDCPHHAQKLDDCLLRKEAEHD